MSHLQRMLEHQAGLLVARHSLWWDDLLQAGRIALWQRPDTPEFALANLARSAMIDEIRRLGGRRRKDRIAPVMVAWSMPGEDDDQAWQDTRTDDDTPEAICSARQTMRALQALGDGWPDALASATTLRAAGEVMRVSESRACQVRTQLWGLCGMDGKPPPLSRGVSHVG
jgi:hypothetical protein